MDAVQCYESASAEDNANLMENKYRLTVVSKSLCYCCL